MQMQPQAPLVFPPFATAGMAAAFAPANAGRQASYELADLHHDGAEFDPALPHNLTQAVATAAQFSPDYDTQASPGLEHVAYCTYRFALDGYSDNPANLASVGFTWDVEPGSWSQFYVGIADYAHARWKWYAGPDDRVLTIDSFVGLYNPSSELLVVVALTGVGATPELAAIDIGVEEIRGTGSELPDTTTPETPPLVEPPGGLPDSVDLAPGCSAINDQRWWPSCTSFALGDGAYNYELNRIYGTCGWDLSQPFNRISPKYMYVISGEFQGWHPPAPPPYRGRWLDYDNQPYWDFGLATEWNAPYDMIYNKGWDAEAEADAALLRVDSWEYVNTMQPGGITNAKIILAVHRLTIPMGVYLDATFFHYTPGTVWNFNGSAVGAHAMVIVGYDDAKQAFKVRNSWGADWGEDGYCWIGYDTFSDPAEYGICLVLHDSFDPAVAERFCDTQPPLPPPAGVSASDGRAYNSIVVRWNIVGAATGYRVYRDDPQAAAVAELGAVQTWTDNGITAGNSHTYWVSALHDAQESALSSPDTGYSAGNPRRGDWYATDHDCRGSRASSHAGPPLMPAGYSWSFDSPESAMAGISLVVQGDGSLVCYHATLLCNLDPDTGEVRWSINLPAAIAGVVLGEDGTIYLTIRSLSADNTLFAFNADGTQKWITGNLANDGLSAPALGPDGTIYVGTDQPFGNWSQVLAFTDDGSSATQKWVYGAGPSRVFKVLAGPDGRVYASVSDGNDDEKVLCLSDDGAGAALVYETSPVAGSATARLEILSVLSNNVLLVNTISDELMAYNIDGTLRWTTAASSTSYQNAGERSDGVIIAQTEKQVYAYHDATTAVTELWSSVQFRYLHSLALGADGKAYVNYEYDNGGAQYHERLAALDPVDGAVRWDFYPNPTVRSELAGLAIGEQGELFMGYEAGLLCLP